MRVASGATAFDPVRVLYLNTRDSFGADVAVHAQIARSLDRTRTRLWAATSAREGPEMSTRAVLETIPDLCVLSLALGHPLHGLRGAARVHALMRNVEGMVSLARLAVRCRREHMDIVHVTERPRDALFGLVLARFAGSACLIHGHTSYYPHDAVHVGDLILRQADAVVGVSRFTAGTYVRDAGLPAERVFAVHNAVDATVFRPDVPESERLAMRRRLGIDEGVPVIGCIARLSQWKGQDTLLEALIAVRRAIPGVRLVFAGISLDAAPDGNGTYADHLKRRIDALGLRDIAILAGFIPHADMPSLYAAVDVVAHPAVEEPFGLAVVEAMASARPLVAVGAGGIPEIVRDGIDGLLVPREQPEALAAALIRVLRDDALAQRLALSGRERVVEMFSPERQAAAMLDVYQRIARRKHGRASDPDLPLAGPGMTPETMEPSRRSQHAGRPVVTANAQATGPTDQSWKENHMAAHLYLVNPPARKGRTNERAQSGGLGVSRKLKLFEKPYVELLPHDFLYQAAVAEQTGHRAQFVDLTLEHIFDNEKGIEFTRGVIARGQSEEPGAPLWIGVRISIPSLHNDVRMANDLKQAFPSARVYAFGNVLMTTFRHWIGEAKFDYIFYGEPEGIIGEALEADDPSTVAGVIDIAHYIPQDKPGLWDMSSSALYRQWRQVRDISKLPRAAWHLLEMGRYAPNGRINELAVSLPASRGCFMPCTMCAYNLHEGRSMRFRTPEEVLEEIEYLYRTYGIRHIRFRDPNFSANKPHLRTIAQGMLDRHLPIEAAAELSLELLDRDLLELMHRAGIRTILTGVESDDPACMASIGQHVKINRILEGKLAICRELGIKVYTFFLIGSPEESWHSVRRTFTFARSLGTECTMTIMTPFPGTPMYWRALRENLLTHGKEMTYENWNSYTATMRTYKLSLRDVTRVRTWARLETYIPYTWNQAKDGTMQQKARMVVRLAPRVAALGALRLVAWWKLRQEEKADPALRNQPQQAAKAPVASGSPISVTRRAAPANGSAPAAEPVPAGKPSASADSETLAGVVQPETSAAETSKQAAAPATVTTPRGKDLGIPVRTITS